MLTRKDVLQMFETLKYEVKDGIAYVTVNRPQAMNALNMQVLDELYTAFYQVAKDEAVKAVIVTGEGKAFVAGADIAQMHQLDAIEGRAMMIKGHNVMNFMESIEKPIIAAVNGFALGGGCELSMACDFRIASEKAKFGQPEVGLGIIPGFGGTQRLPRLVGKGMGKYLIMTAEMIDAQEAQRIGLVEKVVAPEELIPTCEKIAKTIMSKAPIAIAAAKTVINKGYDMDLTTASTLEIEGFTAPFASQDKTEGMGAFLEKRPPEFKNK
ncbi:MAG: enoyl-CoA hydratase-related protein [Bacillota bacterium]|nr:enoyl-CoA hydratase-related protein [Bacillota bacterium]